MGFFLVQPCHQMSDKYFPCSCFCSITPISNKGKLEEELCLEQGYGVQMEGAPSYGLEHTLGTFRPWQWWTVHRNLISHLILLLHGQSEMLIMYSFFFSLLPSNHFLCRLSSSHIPISASAEHLACPAAKFSWTATLWDLTGCQMWLFGSLHPLKWGF